MDDESHPSTKKDTYELRKIFKTLLNILNKFLMNNFLFKLEFSLDNEL